jgi:hypothetical protein
LPSLAPSFGHAGDHRGGGSGVDLDPRQPCNSLCPATLTTPTSGLPNPLVSDGSVSLFDSAHDGKLPAIQERPVTPGRPSDVPRDIPAPSSPPFEAPSDSDCLLAPPVASSQASSCPPSLQVDCVHSTVVSGPVPSSGGSAPASPSSQPAALALGDLFADAVRLHGLLVDRDHTAGSYQAFDTALDTAFPSTLDRWLAGIPQVQHAQFTCSMLCSLCAGL